MEERDVGRESRRKESSRSGLWRRAAAERDEARRCPCMHVHILPSMFFYLALLGRSLSILIIFFFRLSPATIQTVADRVSPSRDARDYITCPQSLSWPELDRQTERQKPQPPSILFIPNRNHNGRVRVAYSTGSCVLFLFSIVCFVLHGRRPANTCPVSTPRNSASSPLAWRRSS